MSMQCALAVAIGAFVGSWLIVPSVFHLIFKRSALPENSPFKRTYARGFFVGLVAAALVLGCAYLASCLIS